MDLLESLPCPALMRGEELMENRGMRDLMEREEEALLLDSVTPGEKKTVMIGGKRYTALLSAAGLLLLVPGDGEERDGDDPALSNAAASLRDAVSTAVLVAAALRKKNDPVSRRYAEPLSRNIDRIVRIADNLQTASLGAKDVMHEENLASVLIEAADQVNYYLGAGSVDLRVELGDPVLVCCRELIVSLFMNLTVEALLPAEKEKIAVFLRPGKTYALDFLIPSAPGRREEWEEMLFGGKGEGTGFAAARRVVSLHKGGIFLREEGDKLLVHVTFSRSLRVGADVFGPETLYRGGDYIYMMLSPLKNRSARD